MINDTVGFIRELPADLMDAFRATLEEIEDSDLVVHVVDVSHPACGTQISAVRRILGELGYEKIPELLVFNKIDRMTSEDLLPDTGTHEAIMISALKRQGIESLLERIDDLLPYWPSQLAP